MYAQLRRVDRYPGRVAFTALGSASDRQPILYEGWVDKPGSGAECEYDFSGPARPVHGARSRRSPLLTPRRSPSPVRGPPPAYRRAASSRAVVAVSLT